MPVGWVKIHRKLLDSETIHDDWLCRLWIVCLLKANSKPGRFKGQAIEKGSFAFSYRVLSEYLGVSKNRLKRGLKKLENAGQISLKAGRDFSVVTLCNWETYQSREIESGTPTDTQVDTPTDTQTETQVDPEQERKNIRKKESKTYKASEAAVRIYEIYPRQVKKEAGLKAIDKALCFADEETLTKAVQTFAAANAKTEKRYIPHPTTFFNEKRWLDDWDSWADKTSSGENYARPQTKAQQGRYTNESIDSDIQRIFGST
ncbi:hypothetical protein [uncultured Rubinisphaera sp.]|uniref:hypothetical protein n=1 Tax=uncultured Rubinisphaera sp. TaxID=1678686 RepID=UPI0030DBD0F4